eukprot:6491534-Lingulodinium_polyedra.AAC.1
MQGRWTDVQYLKTECKPKVYEKSDAEGKAIPMRQKKAEATAQYLSRFQWGSGTADQEEAAQDKREARIVQPRVDEYKTGDIEHEEVRAFAEAANNKAPGPGEIRMATFKIMGEE